MEAHSSKVENDKMSNTDQDIEPSSRGKRRNTQLMNDLEPESKRFRVVNQGVQNTLSGEMQNSQIGDLEPELKKMCLHAHTTYDSSASAIKRTLHGTVYQIKILMLIVWSARDQRTGTHYTEFRLATEMDAAEKFDDVVLLIPDPNIVGRYIWRFFQVKHYKKEITVSDLESKLNKNDPFGLFKYFKSFDKINNNDVFKGHTHGSSVIEYYLKDFTIITNTKLEKDECSSLVEEEVIENDEILTYKISQTKCFKLKKSAAVHLAELFEILEIKSASKNSKDDVIDLCEIEKSLNCAKENVELSTTKDEMLLAIDKIPKITFNLSRAKNVETVRSDLIRKIEKTITDMAVLLRFIEKFRLVVCFPDAEELNKLIAENLGRNLNLLNVDLMNAHFEREMLQFLKTKHDRNTAFYSTESADKFFSEMNYKMVSLMNIGLNNDFLDELNKYAISFKQDISLMKQFLSNQNQQILHVSTEFPRIGSLKVHQTLIKSGEYKERDSHIFLRFNSLQLPQTQQHILLLFGFCHDGTNVIKKPYELLIVECPKKVNEIKKVYKLCGELLKILEKNKLKKLILISDQNNIIPDYFKDDLDDKFLTVVDETGFEDIEKESQDKLLSREIDFQGETIHLNNLVDTDLVIDNRIIDQHTLSRIIDENEKISVGSRSHCLSSIGYDHDMYIERKFKEEDKKDEEICEESLIKLDDRIIILADNSGTGKSTTLTSLAIKLKENNKNLWIERINLLDFADSKKSSHSLDRISFGEEDTSKAIEFLTNMLFKSNDNFSNELQRNLFKVSLVHAKPEIVILFDGFDEVCPNHKLKTITLLSALQRSKVKKLAITTRIHMKEELKVHLNPKTFEFTPLSDQRLFLDKYLKWHITHDRNPYSGTVCERTYSDILKTLDDLNKNKFIKIKPRVLFSKISNILEEFSSKNDENIKDLKHRINGFDLSDFTENIIDLWNHTVSNFLNVPLHIKMLSELVIHDSENQLLSRQFKLVDVYQTFIDRKFQIKSDEKDEMKDNPASETTKIIASKNSREIHRWLAIKFLIENYEALNLTATNKLDEFQHLLNKYKKDAKEEILRYGILFWRGNELAFIHRSFAEYFLHDYLIDNIKKEQIGRDLLNIILNEKEFTVNRTFFNNYLSNIDSNEFKIRSNQPEYFRMENFYSKEQYIDNLIDEDNFEIIIFILDKCDPAKLQEVVVFFLSQPLQIIPNFVQNAQNIQNIQEKLKTVLKHIHGDISDPLVWKIIQEKNLENVSRFINWTIERVGYDVIKECLFKKSNINNQVENTILHILFGYRTVFMASEKLAFFLGLLEKYERNNEHLKEILLTNDSFGQNLLFRIIELDDDPEPFLTSVNRCFGSNGLKNLFITAYVRFNHPYETALHKKALKAFQTKNSDKFKQLLNFAIENIEVEDLSTILLTHDYTQGSNILLYLISLILIETSIYLLQRVREKPKLPKYVLQKLILHGRIIKNVMMETSLHMARYSERPDLIELILQIANDDVEFAKDLLITQDILGYTSFGVLTPFDQFHDVLNQFAMNFDSNEKYDREYIQDLIIISIYGPKVFQGEHTVTWLKASTFRYAMDFFITNSQRNKPDWSIATQKVIDLLEKRFEGNGIICQVISSIKPNVNRVANEFERMMREIKNGNCAEAQKILENSQRLGIWKELLLTNINEENILREAVLCSRYKVVITILKCVEPFARVRRALLLNLYGFGKFFDSIIENDSFATVKEILDFVWKYERQIFQAISSLGIMRRFLLQARIIGEEICYSNYKQQWWDELNNLEKISINLFYAFESGNDDELRSELEKAHVFLNGNVNDVFEALVQIENKRTILHLAKGNTFPTLVQWCSEKYPEIVIKILLIVPLIRNTFDNIDGRLIYKHTKELISDEYYEIFKTFLDGEYPISEIELWRQ